ncbi:hypothetical protein KA977_06125, partial [Candidatus Dependentiae bacterium]|nr:hypothetical protein [Candidatus Dependentiae bacterium]
DNKFIEILERMGCVVNYKNSCNSIEIVPPEKLRSAGEIDMSKMQDVVPTAAVAAVFAEGETKIVNIENLKYKECDRFKAIITELRKIGARIEYGTDWIKIYGTDDEKKYLPAEIETYKDHRMAMSFSLAALKIPGLIIKSPECVCKTFPDFYKSFLPLFENMDKEPENYYSEIYKKELIKFQNNINNK